MKERLLNIIKIAVALIAFFTLSSILALGIKHMGFAITDYKDAVIITNALSNDNYKKYKNIKEV